MKAPFLCSPPPEHLVEDGLTPSPRSGARNAALQWAAVTALAASLLLPLAVRAQADPSWSALTSQQRSVLAPLQSDWHQLDAQRRAKWLEIAGRFPNMSPQQQQRMQQRMTEWSRMSPTQRVEARANYQRSKELPRRDRQAEWEAYRALPKEERDALAARARPGSGWDAADDDGTPLRRPPPTQAPTRREKLGEVVRGRDRAIPPALTRGNPGATTNLVNTPPSPPAHQQPGMPRITASPGMVDRATLLPQRGPQGAGVRGAPASGAKNQGRQKQ